MGPPAGQKFPWSDASGESRGLMPKSEFEKFYSIDEKARCCDKGKALSPSSVFSSLSFPPSTTISFTDISFFVL